EGRDRADRRAGRRHRLTTSSTERRYEFLDNRDLRESRQGRCPGQERSDATPLVSERGGGTSLRRLSHEEDHCPRARSYFEPCCPGPCRWRELRHPLNARTPLL